MTARRRLALTMPICVLLLALVAPQSALAVAAYTFDVTLGRSCAAGTGPASTVLTVRLRSPNGTLQGKSTVTTSGSGDWNTCNFWWGADPGDQITATDGSTSRTWTIPSLAFKISRVTDVVSGTGPANSNVKISAYNCQDWGCDFVADTNAATSGSGAFSSDLTALYNIRGGDQVRALWMNGTGDTVRVTQYTPWMEAVLGSHEVSGAANPNTQVTIQLRTAGGSLRGSFTAEGRPYYGSYYGSLHNSAGLVNADVGNKVSGSFANDATLTIFDPMLAGNDATNVITGKCLPNRPFYVDAEDPDYNRSPSYSDYYGVANSSGNFSVDIATLGSNPGFDLVAGDYLYVECRNAKGDVLVAFDEVLP